MFSMTAPDLIHDLQAVAGLLWLLPLILFLPALWRIWQRRSDTADLLVAPYPFIGLVMVSGTVRWMVFPQAIVVMGATELVGWAGVYFLSALAVAFVLVACRAWWRRH